MRHLRYVRPRLEQCRQHTYTHTHSILHEISRDGKSARAFVRPMTLFAFGYSRQRDCAEKSRVHGIVEKSISTLSRVIVGRTASVCICKIIHNRVSLALHVRVLLFLAGKGQRTDTDTVSLLLLCQSMTKKPGQRATRETYNNSNHG